MKLPSRRTVKAALFVSAAYGFHRALLKVQMVGVNVAHNPDTNKTDVFYVHGLQRIDMDNLTTSDLVSAYYALQEATKAVTKRLLESAAAAEVVPTASGPTDQT